MQPFAKPGRFDKSGEYGAANWKLRMLKTWVMRHENASVVSPHRRRWMQSVQGVTIDVIRRTTCRILSRGVSMSNEHHEHSVTNWIAALKEDHSVAGQRLWEKYVEKLARLARKKLGGVSRRAADEDDVVAEVFADFLQGVHERRFERLHDRNDLWQVLAMLTERRAIGHVRKETAAKRGRSQTRGESAFDNPAAQTSEARGIGQVPGHEPDPAFAAELADLLGHLLSLLDNDMLRALARDNLAGYTQEEMAKRNGIALPTVQRKLKLIRNKWDRETLS